MRTRSHVRATMRGRATIPLADAVTIPLLDSSFLPGEEDWLVVGHARAYQDAHADVDQAEPDDFDFAIEVGRMD